NRQSLIHPIWEDKLYQYISGIVQSRNQKMIAINGMPDHIHLFIGFKPSCSLSDLVREIKKSSSLFINQNKLCVTKFNWQEG
ncbi:transposase, partial [Acinetobacter baumannii]